MIEVKDTKKKGGERGKNRKTEMMTGKL